MMQFKVKIFQQEKEGVFIQASERPWWNCCVCAVCRSFVRKVHLRNNKGKEEVLIAPLKVKLLLLLLLYAAPPLLCWASVCRLFIYKCIPRERRDALLLQQHARKCALGPSICERESERGRDFKHIFNRAMSGSSLSVTIAKLTIEPALALK